jgi:hypothetical protein
LGNKSPQVLLLDTAKFLGKYVTLDTTQTITADKRLNAKLSIGIDPSPSYANAGLHIGGTNPDFYLERHAYVNSVFMGGALSGKSATDTVINTASGRTIIFQNNATEVGRLTTTGLGVGGTATERIHAINGNVKVSNAGYNATLYSNSIAFDRAGYNYFDATGAAASLIFRANAATEMLSLTPGLITLNEPGNNMDFRVEGDTDANLLFTDASADAVGIGTNAPANKLHVLSTSFPVARFDRTPASVTNQVYGTNGLYAQHTGTMANGFGSFQLLGGIESGSVYSFGRMSAYMDNANKNYGSLRLAAVENLAWKEALEVRYNGTVRIGDVAGAVNYSSFEADGTYLAVGTATTFEDMLGDVTQVKTSGTGVSINTTESTIDFTTLANLSDYAMINYQMSHKWKAGSNVFPHIHWEQTSANVPNFLIQYRWQRNGQAKTTAWTNYKCSTNNAFTYVSGTLNQISYGAAITPPANYSISDIIQFRVIRDNANTSTVFAGADPYSGTVSITGVDLHFEQDTLGSRTEYTK